MKVVVISNVLKENNIQLLKDTATQIGADICFVESENDIPEDYKSAEVIYGFGMKTAATSKNLKWLSVPSAGVDYLMKPDAFANEECILTNSTGAYGVTIAEHIIAVSLIMMRKLDFFYRGVLDGVWNRPQPQKSLKDSRITVLGTGDIGCCFTKRAKAFEPKSIVGVCRSGKCDYPDYDYVKPVSELDEILPETDLLVMSLPGTPETENIMTRERMNLLPDGAYIVNVGRGSAIDEEALFDALESGKLAGAALDVFKTEPLPKESRLWDAKNILITPHVAGNLTVKHTLDTNVELFCENLICYAEGLPMKHVIDKNKGY